MNTCGRAGPFPIPGWLAAVLLIRHQSSYLPLSVTSARAKLASLSHQMCRPVGGVGETLRFFIFTELQGFEHGMCPHVSRWLCLLEPGC